MSFIESITSAARAVWVHKLRSFLTMLGIIIGIFAVTALISVGQSTNAEVTAQIEGMGTNLLTVNIRDYRADLDLEDVEGMAGLPGVGAVSPYISSTYTLKNGSTSMEDVQVQGVTPDYADIRNYNMANGRFISEKDNTGRLRVAVVGQDVAVELFGSLDVIGNTISINGVKYEIIGVLTAQGSEGTTNEDEVVMIPFVTAQRQMQQTRISMIYASASSSDAVSIAQASIERYMLQYSTEDDGFSVNTQSSMLESLNEVAATQTAMLGGIAGISLLVGGIGIMNIMLVSVMERTREIGIEKAIGATRKDILLQFLLEAVIVSGIGGLIGILLAQFGSGLIGSLMSTTVTVQSGVMLSALGFSILVGVGFGIYPAIKASKLNPIEALRYE
jgi:putative ABC transport system permease protein